MRRLIVFCIVFSSLTAVQALGGCVRCGPHHTCVSGFAAACLLDDTSCLSCGVCNGIPCQLPIQPIGPYSTKLKWIQTDAYLSRVSAQSAPLGAALSKVREHAREGKCVQHAEGYITVGGQEYKLKAWATHSSQTLWAGDEKIVLTEDGWTISKVRKWWPDKELEHGTY